MNTSFHHSRPAPKPYTFFRQLIWFTLLAQINVLVGIPKGSLPQLPNSKINKLKIGSYLPL